MDEKFRDGSIAPKQAVAAFSPNRQRPLFADSFQFMGYDEMTATAASQPWRHQGPAKTERSGGPPLAKSALPEADDSRPGAMLTGKRPPPCP